MPASLKRAPALMESVEQGMQPFPTHALSVACDAWAALDRLQRLSPEELHEQRGVILALEHKINAMKGGRCG